MRNPLRNAAFLEGAAGLVLLFYSASIFLEIRPAVQSHAALKKVGLGATAAVIAIIAVSYISSSALILLRRDLDIGKVKSLTALLDTQSLAKEFFSGAHPMEKQLRRYGFLRNLIVRAFPKTGSLPPQHQQVLLAILNSVFLISGLSLILYLAELYIDDGQMSQSSWTIIDMLWLVVSFVIIGFWVLFARSFSRANAFEAFWSPKFAVGLFVALVLVLYFAGYFPSEFGTEQMAPPQSSAWLWVAVLGSATVWTLGAIIVGIRFRRINGLSRASHDSVIGSFGHHPRDLISAITETSSKISSNVPVWFKLGDWNPEISEQRNLAAGQFKICLEGETALHFDEFAADAIERYLALACVALGLLSVIAACVTVYRYQVVLPFLNFSGFEKVIAGMVCLVFGIVLRRIGLVILSELSWKSAAFLINVDGSFGERREGATTTAGLGRYDSGMRTTYRAEISALEVWSSSFATPWRQEAAYFRFITSTYPGIDLMQRLKETVAHDRNGAGLNYQQTIEYLPRAGA